MSLSLPSTLIEQPHLLQTTQWQRRFARIVGPISNHRLLEFTISVIVNSWLDRGPAGVKSMSFARIK